MFKQKDVNNNDIENDKDNKTNISQLLKEEMIALAYNCVFQQ